MWTHTHFGVIKDYKLGWKIHKFTANQITADVGAIAELQFVRSFTVSWHTAEVTLVAEILLFMCYKLRFFYSSCSSCNFLLFLFCLWLTST